MSIIAAASAIFTVRYAELGASSIVVYEHLMTLDDEINLIWRSRWSIGKCLFLLNRYSVLSVVIFNNFVLFSPNITDEALNGLTGKVQLGLSPSRLQSLRVYAMYAGNTAVLILMASTFLAGFITSTVLMITAMIKYKAISHPAPDILFCLPVDLPRDFYAFWIPILLSETVLCVLALWCGVQNYLQLRGVQRSAQSLIRILIRDSVIYFMVIFAVYLCNLIIWFSNNPSKLQSAVGYTVAMSGVMGNRLVTNVRGMLHSNSELLSFGRSQKYARGRPPPLPITVSFVEPAGDTLDTTTIEMDVHGGH
ncbi:hypothetical protein BXZ70DRAFT_1011474 [Cristinia sonorae]|uniref:DUF6533 domain-containing protein n=1 Tax=Cristinia sonorae TaxID=1940300 RepID=A0A8K0UHT2_9AGAR|nr:hypothetical protein BXZ70DRAFT_1011474 [Cristinia sonorae]